MKAKILVIWMLAYVFGVMIAPAINIESNLLFVVGGLVCLFSVLLIRRSYIFGVLFGLGIIFLAIGNFSYQAQKMISANELLSDKKLQMQLMINDIPQSTPYGFKVGARINKISGISVSTANLLIYLPVDTELKYGELITAEVTPKKYDEKTKWALIKNRYFAQASTKNIEVEGVSTGWWNIFRGWLLGIRIGLNSSIARALPAPEASLASGLILGEKALISPEMTRLLQASGTTHIIALSGYNITIIMGLFIFMRQRFSRLINLLIPVGVILLFTIMTGAAPSLVRAALMGSLPLLGRYLGRESDNFIAILLSAVIMSVFNPFLPIYDVGFQLSFVAFIGIAYIAPILQGILERSKISFSGILTETIGAQIATIPLLMYYFGTFSVVSPFANVVILTLVPIGMLLSFLVGLAGMVSSATGNFLAVPTYILLHFIIESIRYFGSLPWASWKIKIENPMWIFIFYLILFDFWFMLNKFVKKDQ